MCYWVAQSIFVSKYDFKFLILIPLPTACHLKGICQESVA